MLIKVSAAGFIPWVEHFRVQCYNYVGKMFVSRKNNVHCYLATRPGVERL